MDLDFEKFWQEGKARWEKMTTREIAVELGTSVETLYRWVRLGRVPGLSKDFLDLRRRLDPLREFDRGSFEAGSGLIAYEHSWSKEALKGLKRFKSRSNLIEQGFVKGRQGRFEDYLSIRIRDRLGFFANTTPIALLDCQQTWFVVDPDDFPDPLLCEDIDLVTEFIDGCYEEPFRIRPSLYFLVAEAVQDGQMKRREADPSASGPAKKGDTTFEILKHSAEEPWKWPADAG